MANSDQILKELREKVDKFSSEVKVEKVGTVLEVGDGVARVSGLSEIGSLEMLDFSIIAGSASG